MKNIILQYDSWFVILTLLVGLFYAFTLYFKQKHLASKSKLLVFSLFVLRFISVSTISFLLLSPLFKFISEQKSKPVIVLAQDYTTSLQNVQSAKQLAVINEQIHRFKTELSNKYSVQEFALGGDIHPNLKDSFNLKSTNFSKYIEYINESYDNNELAAVILSSDGIFNEGINPDYLNIKFKAPIYTIGLGDTTAKKDIFINNLYYNDIAFLDDKVVVNVDVIAKSAKGQNPKLSLYSVDNRNRLKLLDSKVINIHSDDEFNSQSFVVNTNTTGVLHYKVAISRLKNEVSFENNYKDFFIEVIDSRIKILIYADSPHPDIGTIKDALETDRNHEVTINFPSDNFNPEAFDLIIYHNLPSTRHDISAIHEICIEKGLPEFFIIGTKTNQNKFNGIQDLMKIRGNSTSYNEVQAKIEKDFNLFLIDKFADSNLENFPPLISPFGEYTIGPDSRVLFYQKTRKIETKYPLLVFNTNSNKKTAIFAGTGIYKWRLYNYYQNQNFNVVKSLLNQIIQFLTIKKDKSQWRVKSNKNVYLETESIIFNGELYNDNYEAVNKSEAFLKIINSSSKEYDFVFSREDNYYKLNSGVFPAGNYSYYATTKYGNELLTKKGKFSIIRKDIEKFDLVAKHDVLYKLSSKTGGKLFNIDQVGSLIQLLKDKDAKQIIYHSQKTKKLIDFKWIFWFIIFFLSLEWFIRRYNGTF